MWPQVSRSNLVKSVVKLKREILRNPIGWPHTYTISDLASICHATEETVAFTLGEIVSSACISLTSKSTPDGQTLVTIVCLPAAKTGPCRKVFASQSKT